MKSPIRLYSFVNTLYMSQLQWGIQTAHCVSGLSLQKGKAYKQWAQHDMTIIILNGVNVGRLLELKQIISAGAKKLKLQATSFTEDEHSLGGVITAVAVLVPEWLYTARHVQDEDGDTLRWVAGGTQYTPADNSEIHEFLRAVRLTKMAGI